MNGGQHCGHYQQPPPPLPRHQSRALVPYGSGSCCMRQYHHQQHQCCSPTPSNTSIPSTALQVMPGVEERLLQLEGDKDSLHMQVNISHCILQIDITTFFPIPFFSLPTNTQFLSTHSSPLRCPAKHGGRCVALPLPVILPLTIHLTSDLGRERRGTKIGPFFPCPSVTVF